MVWLFDPSNEMVSLKSNEVVSLISRRVVHTGADGLQNLGPAITSRKGPDNQTSYHLIAKFKSFVLILGGPTGRSPDSPTGQSAPVVNYIL